MCEVEVRILNRWPLTFHLDSHTRQHFFIIFNQLTILFVSYVLCYYCTIYSGLPQNQTQKIAFTPRTFTSPYLIIRIYYIYCGVTFISNFDCNKNIIQKKKLKSSNYAIHILEMKRVVNKFPSNFSLPIFYLPVIHFEWKVSK